MVAARRAIGNALVVEPSDEIREFVVWCLEDVGCNVLDEPDDRSIVSLVARLPISLLVIEPDIPRREQVMATICRAREIAPKLAVIIITGDASNLQCHPADAVLQKPFEVKVLAELVRRLATPSNELLSSRPVVGE